MKPARKKRPKTKRLQITPEHYRALREHLGFTPASAARFFGTDERTERRWSGEPAGPPPAVIVCMALLKALKIGADPAEQLVADQRIGRRL